MLLLELGLIKLLVLERSRGHVRRRRGRLCRILHGDLGIGLLLGHSSSLSGSFSVGTLARWGSMRVERNVLLLEHVSLLVCAVVFEIDSRLTL